MGRAGPPARASMYLRDSAGRRMASCRRRGRAPVRSRRGRPRRDERGGGQARGQTHIYRLQDGKLIEHCRCATISARRCSWGCSRHPRRVAADPPARSQLRGIVGARVVGAMGIRSSRIRRPRLKCASTSCARAGGRIEPAAILPSWRRGFGESSLAYGLSAWARSRRSPRAAARARPGLDGEGRARRARGRGARFSAARGRSR